MTSAASAALDSFWSSYSFTVLTIFALVGVLVLTVAVIEQEVLRAVNPRLRKRNGRVLAVVIYPLSLLALVVIIARFIRLA